MESFKSIIKDDAIYLGYIFDSVLRWKTVSKDENELVEVKHIEFS